MTTLEIIEAVILIPWGIVGAMMAVFIGAVFVDWWVNRR